MLNEGLETLKEHYDLTHNCYHGIFQDSRVEEVTLPSTMKEIGQMTLADCSSLRTIYVKSGCQADLSRVPSSVEIINL